MLLYISCSNEMSEKVRTNPENKIAKDKMDKIENGIFEPGTWRIDSLAENNVIKKILTKDSVIQVFNFRKDGALSGMEVTPSVTKDRKLGKWKVENDSVFFISEKGNIFMRYGYQKKGDVLILNGNFPISSTNKKKPSFYLSKYIEEYNESIYGPKK